jgi:hypothetical protein
LRRPIGRLFAFVGRILTYGVLGASRLRGLATASLRLAHMARHKSSSRNHTWTTPVIFGGRCRFVRRQRARLRIEGEDRRLHAFDPG